MDPIYDVIDLDGTYCRGNTLHIYIREAFRYHLRKGNILRLTRMACHCAARLLHLCSHASFKFGTLEAAGDDEGLMTRFVEKVRSQLSKEVIDIIENSRREGHTVIMATAAPSFYTSMIWDGPLIATPWKPGDAPVPECRAEEKLRRVLEYTSGIRPALAVTDDPAADAPLIAASTQSIIIQKT